MQREIARGIKAPIIRIYPLINKFESDKNIKPISYNIKQILNLYDELLFL